MEISKFYNRSMNDLKGYLKNRVEKMDDPEITQLVFANAYSVALAEKDKEFDFVLSKSIVLPDGFSIFAASMILGEQIEEKISGPDFFEEFLKICECHSFRCFFLGGENDTEISRVVGKIHNKFPDLKISGFYSPAHGVWTVEENDKIISMLRGCPSDILWVGIGSPKQDKWIYHNRNKINVKVAAGVGAAFNFLSGKVKRAPRLFQKIGLEWLYRLCSEPRRLWKRYLVGNLIFSWKILRVLCKIQ